MIGLRVDRFVLRSGQPLKIRGALAAAVAVLATLLGWGALASPALADSPAANVTLSSFSKPTIAADGIEQSVATATVTDGSDNPVSGETLAITPTGMNGVTGTVTDNGDGTYTVTVTDDQVESGTIAVTDTSASPAITSNTEPLSAVAPTVTLGSFSTSSIAADGLDQTTATATVSGPNGNLAGEQLSIVPTNLSGAVGTVTDNHDGTYTVTIDDNQVESGTIAVEDTSPASPVSSSGQAVSAVAPTVDLTLSHSSIADNGLDQTLATVTASGPKGNLPNDAIALTSSGLNGITIGPITNHHDGTYTATITGAQVESGSITAVDDSPAAPVTSSAETLDVVAPTVSLGLSNSSIADDGLDQTLATATVTGPNGNLPDENIAIAPSALSGVSVGTITNHGDGTYTATVTGDQVSSGSMVATDNTPSSPVSSSGTLLHVVAPTVDLALSHGSIADDGIDHTTATASVSGPNGPLPSDGVTFTPSGLSGVTIGGVTNHGDGTYSATITGNQPGSATITANDTSPATPVSSAGQSLSVAGVTVTLGLSKNQIMANGTDQSVATATVTGPNGGLPGDAITFAATNGATAGTVHDNGDGTYTAALTGTRAGDSSVTATDHSPATAVTSQSQALSLTPGPAASVTVNLTPSSIPADGSSHSTATAVVTDANGNQVFGDSITFTANNGVTIVQNGDTATLTSSTETVPSTVTATDTTQNINGSATLYQVAVPSTTSLTSSPSSATTNQSVSLFAAVASGSGSPTGAITFQDDGNPIGNCVGMPISSGHLTATCDTTFASGSPAQLTAVFTPASGSNVAGSTSSVLNLPVSKDATSMLLGFSSTDLRLGQSITYSALVTPAHTGAAGPTGGVLFLDHGVPISSCGGHSLSPIGGTFEATCTVSYTSVSTRSITAVYGGDSNFTGSGSGPITIPVNVDGIIASPMRWTFAASANYTKVLALAVKDAQAGSTILVICKGKSCPYARKETKVTKSGTAVNLEPKFSKRQLKPGTKITVDITRTYWMGRYYSFTIRAKRAPKTSSGCLATGTLTPTKC